MTRLARPMLRLLGRDERGAFGVLIGVLIGGGVLLGMGALVIDVGMIYNERAQLQNGASAAALAVAKSCVNGTCTAASIPQTAQTYADGNAKDNVSRVDSVCGSGNPNLAACLNPGTTAPITRCPPLPASGNYVDVHTSTEQPGGSPFLPPFLARALLGNGAYQGTTVYACARASWGPASSSHSLALTVSLCAWQSLNADSDNDGDAGIDNNDGDDAGHFHRLIPLWIKGKAKGCTPGPDKSGQNLPGGFGWLKPACKTTGSTTCSDPCTATIDINTSVSPPTGTTYTDPGADVTNDCKTALQNDLGKVVDIPVFDSYTSQGSSGAYHVIGLAAFHITGFANMTGTPKTAGVGPTTDSTGYTDPTGYDLCTGPSSFSVGFGTSVFKQECIEGYFTKSLTDLPGPSTSSSSFGVKEIRLTG